MSVDPITTLSPRQEAQRAYLLLENGELAAARRTMDHVIEQHPQDPMLAALRGAMEIAAGELDIALKILRKATRSWPDHPASFVYLAEAHMLQRRLSQAKRALRKANELIPTLDTFEMWSEHVACLEILCGQLSLDQIPEPLVSVEE